MTKTERASAPAAIRFAWLAVLAAALPPVVPSAIAAGGAHFERVGTEGGPPSEIITSIHQDRAGFVWIGSRDGLFRYDGYSFTVFEHDVSDPTSIADNTVRVIYEDRQGNLWVGTNTGGLDRLNRGTLEFEHFRHESGVPDSLSHDSVYTILQDSTGMLWVGTQKGLNRFDPETGTFERFLADPGRPGSIANDYVMTIYEDGRNNLWVGTFGGGLNRWNPNSGGFVAFLHDPADPETISSDQVLAILEHDDDLWVGTMSGLNLMNRDDGAFTRLEHVPDDLSSLSYPLVSALARGEPGKLWVGTYGGGLQELDTTTAVFQTWRHEPRRRNSLESDAIMCLLAGRGGTLWIGTWGGGLNRLRRSALLFAAAAGQAPSPDGLDNPDVTSLIHDRRGGIWVGTRSGDLVRMSPGGGSYRRYLRGGMEGVPRIILALHEDRNGRVWIGTNGALMRLDPETGGLQEWFHDPGDSRSLGPGYVRAILEDHTGRLWVGTGEGGLQRLRDDGRVLQRFLHDPSDPWSLSDDYVTVIVEDRQGKLWVGTRSGGVNAFDPETGRTVRHVPDSLDQNAISHHYVSSIFEDSSGRLWVGTGGGGLNRANRLEDDGVRFTRFTAADGLIDDDVMAIVEDDDGSLWLSTKSGLSRFDTVGESFANFYVADGLPTREFEPGAATRSDDTLYFGSLRWVVPIPAGTPFPSPSASPTVITSIRTSSGEHREDRPSWEIERLEVPYGEWLSLEIAVLDFVTEHNHDFAYRLGDEHEDWVDLGGRRAITFTDLAPGAYDFAVRGRNSQGVWSRPDHPLRIAVVPPFWMTAWFRGFAVLFVIGLAVVVHHVRTNRLEKRNRELLALQEQRERARDELGRAYQRLRRLTRRLEAAKEDERRHIARELHDEMGPTLTAVIINLQLLGKSPDPDKTARKIEDTIDLVDRMIQRVRDLSLDLRPPLLDELGLVAALRGYLETQAERAGLEIEVTGESAVEGLSAEVEITSFRVVQEAVTNVIRHAGAARVAVSVRQDARGIELHVEDNGRGFDVRDTLEGATGKSLGLLGMQERVGMLGGQIEIDSTPGKGTSVRVHVPTEVQP